MPRRRTARDPALPDATSARADFARLGVVVGHASDAEGATGCTVIRAAAGALRGAVTVLGRATGTRELALLEPGHLVDRVDAVLLAGGSAYGLDAAAGVMRWCEERRRGFDVGVGVVPIVPAAVVFDLLPLGRFDARPTADMAYAACEDARAAGIAEGSVGAGTGATCAKVRGSAYAMKGGVGCAVVERDGLVAGALMVVNAFGEVRGPRGETIAGSRARGGDEDTPHAFAEAVGRNTTVGAVVVSEPLSKLALQQLARAASGAIHRRIVPAGSPFDGDVLFALAPAERLEDTRASGGGDGAGERAGGPPQHQHAAPAATDHHHEPAPIGGISPDPALAMRLEALAADAIERAIERAVRLARGRDGIPGLADHTA